ncbi:MAG: FAD-dependent oxidoreductase [Sphingobium sp.]
MSVLQRRNFLKGSGLALAALPAGQSIAAPIVDGTVPDPRTLPGPAFRQRSPLAPVRASLDRLISLEVCTRPFRPQGPRIEREAIGRKVVIHNYGHGGSGWSLSWGSARRAVALARATGEKSIAVIGCGAIGMTTAVEAQRAGLKVRVYSKEFFPYVRSFRATGVWSPSARIVALEHATPEFRKIWEDMARYSYFRYSSLLGLPGNPVEWTENYKLSDTPFATGSSLYTHNPYPDEPDYPHLEDEHTPDLMTKMQDLTKDQHPFPVAYARRANTLMFNIPAYADYLMERFIAQGGEAVEREFENPRQFDDLPEKTIVHCTGYSARALMRDDSLVPVRGQTARLIPQPEVDYSVSYDSRNVYTISRRDALVVQAWDPGDYGSEGITPNPATTIAAIEKVAALFAASKSEIPKAGQERAGTVPQHNQR